MSTKTTPQQHIARVFPFHCLVLASFVAVAGLSHSSQCDAAGSITQDKSERNVPEIKWDTSIIHFQFDSDKFVGQRLTVYCPPIQDTSKLESIFGTDFYPSETPVCVAALHSGVIDKDGGTVTIQLNPGRSAYTGSDRNGVVSTDLPGTRRSISFVGGPSASETDKIHLERVPRIQWDTKFTSTGFANRKLIGQRFTFRCGSVPLDRKARLVFGTDHYDFASKIGWAALHAGALTREGGIVTLQINPGGRKLVGSIRNGLETRGKGSSDRTIKFVENPVKDPVKNSVK